MGTSNAINADSAGLVKYNGTGTFSGVTTTNHNLLIGAASNGITNVAPSATSGVPVISQGASSDPTFGTAVVAGGGTGLTSTTAYGVICGGTSTTGNLQNTGAGSSGQYFISNGSASLPTFQTVTPVTTINGNSGSATGATITVKGNDIGSSATFTASSSTVNFSVTDANHNTIMGSTAGNGSITGTYNTGFGYEQFASLSSGGGNQAFGGNSLRYVTTGSGNVGMGSPTHGTMDTGSNNIAIGNFAGNNWTGAESNNICMNTGATVGESNGLHIGDATGTGAGQLNKAYICGITGIVVTGAPILISSSNQLGVAASSIRYKENIESMGAATSALMDLRPVIFTWKEGVFNEKSPEETQFGLIAEEVEKIFPFLVIRDDQGVVLSVKYHELPVMLLNELQKSNQKIASLESRLEKLENKLYTMSGNGNK